MPSARVSGAEFPAARRPTPGSCSPDARPTRPRADLQLQRHNPGTDPDDSAAPSTGTGVDASFAPTRLIVAGYTGRDQDAVATHIARARRDRGARARHACPRFYDLDPRRCSPPTRSSRSTAPTPPARSSRCWSARRAATTWPSAPTTPTATSRRDDVAASKAACPKPIGAAVVDLGPTTRTRSTGTTSPRRSSVDGAPYQDGSAGRAAAARRRPDPAARRRPHPPTPGRTSSSSVAPPRCSAGRSSRRLAGSSPGLSRGHGSTTPTNQTAPGESDDHQRGPSRPRRPDAHRQGLPGSPATTTARSTSTAARRRRDHPRRVRPVAHTVAELFDLAADPASDMRCDRPGDRAPRPTGSTSRRAAPRTSPRSGAPSQTWADVTPTAGWAAPPTTSARSSPRFAAHPEAFAERGRGARLRGQRRRLLPAAARRAALRLLRDHPATGVPRHDGARLGGRATSRPAWSRNAPEGLVLRGAQMLATGAAVADEILVSCIKPLQAEDDQDFAISFAVPVNAAGLKLYCRRPYAPAATSDFDYPLSDPLRRDRRPAGVRRRARAVGSRVRRPRRRRAAPSVLRDRRPRPGQLAGADPVRGEAASSSPAWPQGRRGQRRRQVPRRRGEARRAGQPRRAASSPGCWPPSTPPRPTQQGLWRPGRAPLYGAMGLQAEIYPRVLGDPARPRRRRRAAGPLQRRGPAATAHDPRRHRPVRAVSPGVRPRSASSCSSWSGTPSAASSPDATTSTRCSTPAPRSW